MLCPTERINHAVNSDAMQQRLTSTAVFCLTISDGLQTPSCNDRLETQTGIQTAAVSNKLPASYVTCTLRCDIIVTSDRRHYQVIYIYKLTSYNTIMCIFIHHNMIESNKQKKNSKKQQEKEKEREREKNSGTSYSNLHMTFSHERYFATNVSQQLLQC